LNNNKKVYLLNFYNKIILYKLKIFLYLIVNKEFKETVRIGTLIKDASKTMEKKEPKGFIYNSKNKIKFKLK
jgi:hypothetical protein